MAEKVFLGMSGGVDSSVAAILLKMAGYDVTGYTFRVYDSVNEDCLKRQKGCCTVESIFGAKDIAERLGIKHYVIDLRKEFAETVIKDFTSSYLSGRTPNPCVECNKFIKWGLIMEHAGLHECRYIATGHYASVKTDGSDFYLSGARDKEKDQTYFLWQIPRELLANTLFPLGELNKTEVRRIAKENGFEKVSEKTDSQEICFIPGDDYRKFLIENVKDLPGEGNYVDPNGIILGKHNGFPFYTVGQRKGLGIALGERKYVTDIRPEKNEVVIGSKDDLLSDGMIVSNINPGKENNPEPGKSYKVKIRYRSRSVNVTAVEVNGSTATFRFKEPVSAVTPGQSAVFYNDDSDVLFGSKIEKALK